MLKLEFYCKTRFCLFHNLFFQHHFYANLFNKNFFVMFEAVLPKFLRYIAQKAWEIWRFGWKNWLKSFENYWNSISNCLNWIFKMLKLVFKMQKLPIPALHLQVLGWKWHKKFVWRYYANFGKGNKVLYPLSGLRRNCPKKWLDRFFTKIFKRELFKILPKCPKTLDFLQ